MAFPLPQALLAPLASRLPPHPIWLLPALAGAGLLGAAGAVAFHHAWIGAVLLLAAALAAGLGQAQLVLTLSLLALPFSFALADASRALAAMFVMFALTVLTVLGRGHVSVVTWLAVAGFLLACFLPDRFSLLAYLIGISAFVAAGQGVAQGAFQKSGQP
jgi:hypothetical protein